MTTTPTYSLTYLEIRKSLEDTLRTFGPHFKLRTDRADEVDPEAFAKRLAGNLVAVAPEGNNPHARKTLGLEPVENAATDLLRAVRLVLALDDGDEGVVGERGWRVNLDPKAREQLEAAVEGATESRM